MPSADGLDESPQFDFDPPEEGSSTPPQQQAPPAKSKKKKSKKKQQQQVKERQQRVEDGDGDESSSYPKSVTPSPPVHHGVKLQVDSPVQGAAEGATDTDNTPPLVDLNEEEDEEPTLFEQFDDPEPEPSPPPSRPVVAVIPPPTTAPPAAPPVKSPRPAVARPLPPSSPQSRPLSTYNTRGRQDSLSTHRPPPTQQPTRRESFVNPHPSPRPRFVDPPPPHMPQQHFFQLPDIGLGWGKKQETGRPAGSDGYCCRLDTFADGGDGPSSKKAKDALLVGCEGGLEVFRVLATKMEIIARLEGLGGAVIGAKILPHTERLDPLQELRPLVAVVVHGPMLDHRGEERLNDDHNPPSHFQTTVDVYSLRAQRYVATLYRSAPVPIEKPQMGQVSSLPDPAGDLHLDAAGRFITVTSGKSGEVWVFTAVPNCGLEEAHYRCIGKFWTSLQTSMTPPAVRVPGVAGEAATTEGETKEQPRTPLYSLSQRWLAILPPSSTSSISIQGVSILSEINPSPPGISTHAAPPQPLVTCEVVGTDPEGTWSRLGRQAAQGLVKYSQKGFEMGLQGWKELTHPSPPNGRPPQDRPSTKEDMFPPTKAFLDDPGRLRKEPALVSLIDLEGLLQWEEHKPKYFPPPMATFALVEGCNFLSFSSTGTRLLTASRKGEVSTVWDLRQVAHGVSNRGTVHDDDVSTSPCIKQLQRIARNTPSTILECAWSRDDDAVALLTAHGTVHLHEITTKPAPRKRKRISANYAEPTAEKADATVSLSTGLSPPSSNQGFLGSIKSSWTAVSSQVNTLRSINGPAIPTTFAGFRDATAAAGNFSSRAVARGISQGYTAAKGGAADYWHADDNKIRHTKALQEPNSAKSVKWIKRNQTVYLSIACGGQVHVHPVQKLERMKGNVVVSGLRHEKHSIKTFGLGMIQTRAEMGGLQGLKISDPCRDQGVHGFWSLRSAVGGGGIEEEKGRGGGLREVGSDVETNPPYCPFHVDPRVMVYAFEEDSTDFVGFAMKGHGEEDGGGGPWTFGDVMPARVKISERRSDDFDERDGFSASDMGLRGEDDDDEDEEDAGGMMESRLTIQPASSSSGSGSRGKHGGAGGQEEIRIHTSRKKRVGRGRLGGNHGGGDDGEEGFEFEDGL